MKIFSIEMPYIVYKIMAVTLILSFLLLLVTYAQTAMNYNTEMIILHESEEIELGDDYSFSLYPDDFCLWEYLVSVHGAERMYNQSRSLDILQGLHESFPHIRAGRISYPPFYGGSYLDDNGNLVILVVSSAMLDSDDTHLEAFLHELSINEVTVRQVEFAYRDLIATSTILRGLISDSSHVINQLVNTWYSDIMNNRLAVELHELSEEKIALFRSEVYDSPIIIFRESRGPARTLRRDE